MSMSWLALAAEGEEKVHELPMPAYMYGVIALAAFALLLAVTWAFRGTAAKLGAPRGHGHAGGSHRTDPHGTGVGHH